MGRSKDNVDEPSLPDFVFTEPTEEELLRELQELGIAEFDSSNPTHAEAMAMEEGVHHRRNIPVDLADYNVDNMELTPEDENDPALLAELAVLEGSGRLQESAHDLKQKSEPTLELKPEKSVEERMNEAKSRALGLKRSGDMEGAKTALQEYERLKALLAKDPQPSEISQPTPTHPAMEKSSEIDLLKELALEAKRAGDLDQARSLMSQILALQGNPTKSVKAKLLAQAKECQEAARIMMNRGDRTAASDFTRKEKAFALDVKKGVQGEKETVQVELPVDTTNYNVAPDELSVHLSALTLSKRSKMTPSAKVEYFIQTLLEWPVDDATNHRQNTAKFAIATNSAELMDRKITYKAIKRDMRSIKFFEHHKIRVELYRVESSFFRTKNVLVGWTALRMGPLTAETRTEETLDLVDENRKQIGVSITVALELRTPLKSSSQSMKTANWVVMVDGESGRIFNPPPPESVEADTIVSCIRSYVVLEHEIARLKADPVAETDPALVALLGALEGKLYDLTVKVELGQLSMEDYLSNVQDAIPEAKRMALECKRAGKMNDARNWLKHVHMMEEEISEAQQEPEDAA
ncbi:hypothetical protein PSACC_02412 [Paramicrosporidium saccamoebae]|uniref:DM14 domain-containing protein n=1 Tax=Paramicrosporidium saccamoebae TaxID=1246581 RepID=A0A2H9TJ45_9FUNG|nr:hypothetical protein PSACC_02412 [Paramicrosporidium saccamoebae]